jgi:hypothetical protein
VSLSRVFVVLCALLALPACGSSKDSQPAGEQQPTATPPAIEAIDEPPAVGLEMPPVDASSSSTYLCLGRFGDEAEPTPEDCRPTPDEAEKFHRMQEKFEQAVKPAIGTEPRAIARLRLTARGPTADARLIAWGNRSDKLCIETEVEDESGGSSDGPSGPCVPESRCNEICLGLSGSGSGSASRYLLSGVVASEADTLRMTLDDGRVVDYGLTGPIVPGFHEYRVVMLDLGRDLDQRLELRRDDKTIAEEKRSPVEIKMMRCEEDFPPALPSQDSPGGKSPLGQCLERAAPE